MVIKNTSSKIINIGSEVLMPDAAITVDKSIASAPSVQTLSDMGFIKIEEGETANAGTKTGRKRSTAKPAEKVETENASKPSDAPSSQSV